MQSVDVQQRRQQRQIEVMLALGELVAVTDPETGEVHYMATDRLVGGTGEAPPPVTVVGAGPRHARGDKQSWRLRSIMVVLASGLVLSAAMPAAVSMSTRPGLHRLIDDHDDDDQRPVRPSVPSRSRVAVISGTAEALPGHAVPVVQQTPGRRVIMRPVLTTGRGRHRAGHKSNRHSNPWWRFGSSFDRSGVNTQVRAGYLNRMNLAADVMVRDRAHT